MTFNYVDCGEKQLWDLHSGMTPERSHIAPYGLPSHSDGSMRPPSRIDPGPASVLTENDITKNQSEKTYTRNSSGTSISLAKLPTDQSSAKRTITKLVSYMGPGLVISITYSDPGNYSTAIAGGAQFGYSLLCTILVAQVMAIVLQSLSAKLAVVTSQSLPATVHARHSRWVSTLFWILCEMSLLAADLPQVVGIAISLNILLQIPLPYAISCSMLDIVLTLLLWRPDGTIRSIRWLEVVVAGVISIVMVAFVIVLARLLEIDSMTVLKGYLPSRQLFGYEEAVASMSIFGAIVMPHALLLGSCVRQTFDAATCRNCPKARARMLEKLDKGPATEASVQAAVRFNIWEIALSLMTIPMFINSAILIIASGTMYAKPGSTDVDADLFAVHHFFLQQANSTIANVFALSMLLSGISAGIVISLTGQSLAPLYPFKKDLAPWQRRVVTRGVLLLTLTLLTVAAGSDALVTAMNGSQTVLTILLPFIAGPLVYYTGSSKVMTLHVADLTTRATRRANMRNHFILQIVAWTFWLGLVVMDCHLIVTSIIYYAKRGFTG